MARSKEPKPKKPPTPKQRQPWDPPPYPNAGDASDEITFAAVGRALTAWEGFEISMATLFARFIGVQTDTLPATRAYGSVLTFRGRAEMVEAASEAYFFSTPDSEPEPELNEVLKEARNYATRRNEIAHGIVRSFEVPDGIIVRNAFGPVRRMKKWGYAVVPSDYATNKTILTRGPTILHGTERRPKYTYTSVEIDAFAKHFTALGDRTSVLTQRVFQHSLNRS